MKTALTLVLTLGLTAVVGCQSMSRRGGGAASDEGFTIGVPGFGMGTEIKQGDTQTVTLTLTRGSQFKRDVKLDIQAARGISVDPTSVRVKASDSPEVQVRVTAARDAAFGDYRVLVTGTPETGEPTSVVFTVKVVAP